MAKHSFEYLESESKWAENSNANGYPKNYNKNMALWQKLNNIVVFPHGWQLPAKTEKWAFERLADFKFASNYIQMVCFPWATFIDLLNHGKAEDRSFYLNALECAPPRNSLIRATVCQHIFAKDILEWFHRLKITDLYWPHTIQSEFEIEGIRVHPFPLYPVRCFDEADEFMQQQQSIMNRRYLFSFVGAYEAEKYLTPVREWIFNLAGCPNSYIERRDEWHYLKKVYGEQVFKQTISSADKEQYNIKSREYVAVMRDSIFSLCPSGSGPNSIRLWESLGFGCIPVVLADQLRLPGSQSEWDKAIIRVPEVEQSVGELPERLSRVARDAERLSEMRAAGNKLWLKYGVNGPVSILKEFNNTKRIYRLAINKRGYIREGR